MTYQEALDFLYTQLPVYQKIGKKAFNKDLAKTVELCRFLGNPEQDFQTIHVAGTNGKGGTSHMLASILQASGLKVGLYTSPHLKSFRERIRINGSMIMESFVPGFVHKIQPVIKKIQPSFFEITVAMAFDYFSKEDVDIAVIETGLGGRLDSTNVITPILSVITSIGLDHMDILGGTIKEIAAEKGGIIKNGVPVVVGSVDSVSHEVLEKIAERNNSVLHDAEGGFDFQSDLKGASFSLNLSTVIKSVECLKDMGYSISKSELASGLRSVCKNTGLKGRWQILNQEPLTVCDIGHNVQAVESLLEEMKKVSYRQLHIVWGMAKDKSVAEVLSLLPKDACYYFCAAKIERAMSALDLSLEADKQGLSGKVCESVGSAIAWTKDKAKSDDLIFIGGSTFVVAEIEGL